METSYLKTLELDKILARAAEGCVCKEARAMLLAIEHYVKSGIKYLGGV